MLVRYIRDGRDPVATVVALDKDRLGVSFCRSDEHFHKSLGKQYAIEQAEKNQLFPVDDKGDPKIPNRTIIVLIPEDDYNPETRTLSYYDRREKVSLREAVYHAVEAMKKRAAKYFGDTPNPVEQERVAQ